MDFFAWAARSFRILFLPLREWGHIKTENKHWRQLFSFYALPYLAILAIIEAVSTAAKNSLGAGIAKAAISTLSSVIFIFAASWIIFLLRRNFKAKLSYSQAFAAVTYACTAEWIIRFVSHIIELPKFAALLHLYMYLLLYWGISSMAQVPEAHTFQFRFVALLLALLLNVLVQSAAYRLAMGL
jgi:hypothetical protein